MAIVYLMIDVRYLLNTPTNDAALNLIDVLLPYLHDHGFLDNSKLVLVYAQRS